MKRIIQPFIANWPSVLVLALVFGYLLTGFNKGLGLYDEGLAVYGSDRVLHGSLPYRDFWTLYGPASFYMLAWLFKVFGSSLMVERIWALVVVVAAVLLSYAAARRYGSARLALIVPVLIAISLYDPGSGPDNPILVFGLLSMLFLLNHISTRRYSWLFLAGLSIGIIALLRLDQGVLLCLTALVVLAMYAAADHGHGESLGRRSVRSLKASACVLSAAAVVTIPTAIWILKSIPFGYLNEAFFVYPLKVYPMVRSLPFPAPIVSPSVLAKGIPLTDYLLGSISQIQFYFPIVIYGISGILLVRILGRRKVAILDTDLFPMAVLLAYGLCFLSHMATRADQGHLRGAIIMAAIMMPAVMSRIPRHRMLRGVSWALVVLTGFIPAGRMVVNVVSSLVDQSHNYMTFSMDRARGISVPMDFVEYQNLVGYIQEIVPEGQKIFVGNLRHDLVFANDSMLYFLADRPCATRYNELDPGVANTMSVQRQIIADIQRNDVKVIVLRTPILAPEPNDSRKSTGVVILDQFLRQNFHPDRQFDYYTVAVRNGSN